MEMVYSFEAMLVPLEGSILAERRRRVQGNGNDIFI
jgi:hypothetical protein